MVLIIHILIDFFGDSSFKKQQQQFFLCIYYALGGFKVLLANHGQQIMHFVLISERKKN